MALDSAELARRVRDAWRPPADLLAAAAAHPFPYTPVSPTTVAQLPVGPGLRKLVAALRARYPIIWTSYERGRSLDEGAGISVHHEGRASDLMVHEVDGRPDRRGDAIANWLLAHAREVGVDYVIWAGTQWNSRTGRASLYEGPSGHTEHVHFEMVPSAAANPDLVIPADGAPPLAALAVFVLGATAGWAAATYLAAWARKR